MARGNIDKRSLDDGRVRYDVIVDMRIDSISGKRRQRKKTFRTKKEAQTALTGWQAEIDKGAAIDGSRQTVAELLRYWLTTYARHNVRPVTFDGYERTIEKRIIPALGHVPVQKLTPDQVQSLYSSQIKAGAGPSTVQLCHLRLSQALTQAVKLGLVARDVTDVVTPPRVTTKEMQTWDVVQARRFMEVAHQSHFGPIWTLSLITGMRRGELLGLHWQDVDFERGVLHIRQTRGVIRGRRFIGQPKSKSARRTVPVPPQMIAELREHKRNQNERRLSMDAPWHDQDLVFCTSEGNPISPRNLVHDYDYWVTLARVPRIRIHDQRHTHVTRAREKSGRGEERRALGERGPPARPRVRSGTGEQRSERPRSPDDFSRTLPTLPLHLSLAQTSRPYPSGSATPRPRLPWTSTRTSCSSSTPRCQTKLAARCSATRSRKGVSSNL